MATTTYKQLKSAPAATESAVNHSKMDTLDVSVANASKSAGSEKIKTSGIKVRGTGAATKGLMARGPMA